jgi:ADP-heptose:LPS heptosyltransferase
MSDGCEDMELYGVSINDFYDVAMLINSVEQVISIDTAILHLAGAMNKPTIGLLSNDTDERWRIRNWYPSVKLMQGNWEGMLKNIMNSLEEVALEPISFNWTVDDFVVTKAVKQYCEDS